MNADEKGFVQNEVNILTRWRITSTFELLKNVEHVYLLVTGDNKKEIIKKIGKKEMTSKATQPYLTQNAGVMKMKFF